MSMVALLAIAYGVKHVAEGGVTIAAAAAFLLGGFVGWKFIHRQGRLAAPLVDLGLFRNGAFTAALGANMMALFAWVGASLLTAQYLQLVIGMSPMTAGLWTIPPAIACVVGCLGAPVLVQRVSPAVVVTLALLLVATGFAIMTAFTSGFGLVVIISGMIILGLGVATIVTLGTDLILTAAPPEKAGAASAISETGASLGGSVGVAVLGSVGVAAYRAAVAIPEGLSGDHSAAARNTLGQLSTSPALCPSPSGSVLLASAQQAFEQGLVFASGAGFASCCPPQFSLRGPTCAVVPCAQQLITKEKSDGQQRNEQAIPTLIDDWTDAICKGDIDRVLANRTDDIVMYDVPEPIQVKGIDAYKDMWKLFFEHNAAGPDRFRLSDVQVVAGDDSPTPMGF